MKVVAIAPGFYQGSRKRIGAIFDMSEDDMKRTPGKDAKDKGKPIIPSWVKPVQDEKQAKKEAEKVIKDAEKKQIDGALAASGGPAAKAKTDATAKELAG